jgi:hypothetical protein
MMMIASMGGLLAIAVPSGHAQSSTATPTASGSTATPTPDPQVSDGGRLPFSWLGMGEEVMRGPYGSVDRVFAVPADWELTEGAELRLNIKVFPGSEGASLVAETPVVLGGEMEISFNDVVLSHLLLDQAGEQNLTLKVPPEALVPSRSDGRHEFNLAFDSNLGCEVIQQPTVVVHSTSELILPHRSKSPPVDLTRWPYPIYQASFRPDWAAVVVPDQPTARELQAALAVVTGFGKSTSGDLNLEFVTAGQLTEEMQRTHHLIFVGKPAGWPALDEVELAAPLKGSGFDVPGAQENDGILQMAISPWNPARVVLVVGGATDASVIKAGQAVSAGAIRTSRRPDLAVVADIQPSASDSEFVPTDRTFTGLGYDNRAVQRSGSSTLSYFFYVPVGQGAAEGAYVDLVFNHSALINYDRSSLVITLNNEPIGSTRLSDATTTLTAQRIPIPPVFVRPGLNRLALQTNLVDRGGCTDSRQQDVWLAVSSDSLIHLPLAPAAQAEVTGRYDLSQYPAPFSFSPTLDKVAFVLPDRDLPVWRTAAQIVYHLGDTINVPLFNALVVFDNAIPEEVRQTHDLFVIGRPQELSLVSELAYALPAPFEPGGQVATERGSTVVYRLPPDASVSYLELLTAPWNEERTILAVLGNSDESLQWAANALTISSLRARLSGNYAVVNGEQIIAADTRLLPSTTSLVATAVPGGVVDTTPVTTEQPAIKRPAWLLPVLGVSIALMVLVVGIAIFNVWQAQNVRH